MRLIFTCPTCNKQSSVLKEILSRTGAASILKLSCGHLSSKYHLVKSDKDLYSNLVFSDGRKLRPYQSDTCQFAESSDLSFLCAHEMGLGKTIIALALLKVRKQELLPTVIFCKSGLRRQWMHETISCLGPTLVQCINTSKDFPLERFQVFIVSLDMLRDLDSQPWIGKVKSIIIDEVQLIKSHDSKRTNAVRRFARDTNAKIIGLSGTPIKNNPGEYYPILNLLRPELFPTRAQFISDHCIFSTGHYGTKVSRLISPRNFKEFTKSFIIRYERSEVAPDLPKIDRQFRFIDMTQDLMKAYEEVVTEFESFVRVNEDKEGHETFTNILAYLAKMRHITGLAKIETVVDFTTDFLLETDRKLTIFLHHKDVHQILKSRLDEFLIAGGYKPTLNLSSELDSDQRHEVVTKFWTPEYRILIASTLSSGEGLNLQTCSDAVMMERQWNPANEEQAEARFTRIGSTAEKVSVTYPTAVGTVDEFLAQIIERKRQIALETFRGEEQTNWSESSIIRELTEIIVNQQLKHWSMPKGN